MSNKTTPDDAPRGSDGVPLIPQPHGGALRRGNPGNAGGGRPPDQIRRKVRELGWDVLVDMLEGYHLARHTLPERAGLKNLKKTQIVDLLDKIRVYVEIPWKERRQILDTALKYGIGTKHVHTGGDEDGDQTVGIVMMPRLGEGPTRCPRCGWSEGDPIPNENGDGD